MPCTLRPAMLDDAEAITAIYNDAIANTTAIMWHQPKPDLYWRDRLADRPAKFPALVAVSDEARGNPGSGRVIGFTTLGPYDDLCGYCDAAEWSLYVEAACRGQGVGKALALAVIDAGRVAGLHSIISRVTAGNDASARLQASLGFRHVGTFENLGDKFGQRHDVLVYQLVL